MFTLKLVFEEDIHKISLENLSISELYQKITLLFSELSNITFENLFLYYIDDEKDKIRIKLDLELSEAWRFTGAKRWNSEDFYSKTEL